MGAKKKPSEKSKHGTATKGGKEPAGKRKHAWTPKARAERSARRGRDVEPDAADEDAAKGSAGGTEMGRITRALEGDSMGAITAALDGEHDDDDERAIIEGEQREDLAEATAAPVTADVGGQTNPGDAADADDEEPVMDVTPRVEPGNLVELMEEQRALSAASSIPGPAITTETDHPELSTDEKLSALGFQRTGPDLGKVAPDDLAIAADRLATDDLSDEERASCEGVVAESGWFMPPAGSPEETASRLNLMKAEVEAAEAGIAVSKVEAANLISIAKGKYEDSLARFRKACEDAGVPCVFGGGAHKRAANVAPKVTFTVERIGDDVAIMIDGRPETRDLVPVATIMASFGKAAEAYTEKHLGPRSVIGKKFGSLYNKLRALLVPGAAAETAPAAGAA